MATVLEAPAPESAPVGHDVATAIALDSLGLGSSPYALAFTPLPRYVVQGVIALSGLITGVVWLARLTGRA
jgi:hypothetical protein